MKINSLSYWLKGGLVGVAIVFVSTLYIVFFSVEDGSVIDWLMLIPLMPYAFAAFWFGGIMNLITGISAQALIYFIVGSIIGFLYGKIKQRKQTNT